MNAIGQSEVYTREIVSLDNQEKHNSIEIVVEKTKSHNIKEWLTANQIENHYSGFNNIETYNIAHIFDTDVLLAHNRQHGTEHYFFIKNNFLYNLSFKNTDLTEQTWILEHIKFHQL